MPAATQDRSTRPAPRAGRRDGPPARPDRSRLLAAVAGVAIRLVVTRPARSALRLRTVRWGLVVAVTAAVVPHGALHDHFGEHHGSDAGRSSAVSARSRRSNGAYSRGVARRHDPCRGTTGGEDSSPGDGGWRGGSGRRAPNVVDLTDGARSVNPYSREIIMFWLPPEERVCTGFASRFWARSAHGVTTPNSISVRPSSGPCWPCSCCGVAVRRPPRSWSTRCGARSRRYAR